jgi:hypothetical protein
LRAGWSTLRAIGENHALRFLLDARNAKLVIAEDERWIWEDLLPRFALAGIRWTAVVVPANQLAAIMLADITETPPSGELQREQFGTLDEAEAWLSSKMGRLESSREG